MKDVDPINALFMFLAASFFVTAICLTYASAASDKYEATVAAECLRAGKEWRTVDDVPGTHECRSAGAR